ncbi:MAG TPA: DUF711 family protein [Terriglobales bacterium]|nr:DUF711 family protein [Terriglobales bacterium]
MALAALVAIPLPAIGAEKPKVRAITAFVKLDRARYQHQVHEALGMLRQARQAFQQAGYEVQSLRIATQPFPEYVRGLSREEALAFFKEYDELARAEQFDPAIGPAMPLDSDDAAQADLLVDILRQTKLLNASLTVADEQGVHWRGVRAAARIVKSLSETSPQANFNFAAAARVPSGTPFFPAAYHNGEGHEFAIGLESANVVAEALASSRDPELARHALELALGQYADQIEQVALTVELRTGWKYGGLDLSPAPLKQVSIGAAIEGFTGHHVGASGTMTAVAVITGVLRSLPVKRAGYSGLMLPVLEDETLARRWSEGAITVDELLAYSAVCGTGLDTVPLPGEITAEQLERIIGDMATMAVRLQKPLSARLMPVAGKRAGDKTEFNDPFLVNAVLQPLP